MKFGLALAAALTFGTLGMGATGVSAASGKTTMQTGSNADAGGGASSGKMSGGKMQSKSMKKKKM
ncbi:hypothetical protein [Methylobacterium brachythecii]|uniref:Pentapeptide MXKDX repeat protein n=1 Tax=Methylobacterium brachythecii TaxID=1176177 RepID=A0A7W6AN30_9HYPH|nr:hypothetical protein [Methylobacterium brachythecii]MBB3905621.1 hypothetical protein [Methylobacterium brachythecii]GLS46952.1 hypothetical protein GCM10007884_49520 [Methylobacterium brachythecii]